MPSGLILGVRGRWILQLTIHRLRTDKPFATKKPNEPLPDTVTDNRTNTNKETQLASLAESV